MRFFLILLTTLIVLANAGMASADHKTRFHIPAELRGEGKVPYCDDGGVIKKITKRFRKNNIHHRDNDLEFERMEEIRETGFVKNPSDNTDRRYCAARVYLTNGKHPTVYYLVLERDGLASLTWGVDFCVSGLDFERAHGSHCRSLRAPY